jgi:hypothetical protein
LLLEDNRMQVPGANADVCVGGAGPWTINSPEERLLVLAAILGIAGWELPFNTKIPGGISMEEDGFSDGSNTIPDVLGMFSSLPFVEEGTLMS